MSHTVVAPYVTLKVRDVGGVSLRGFYAGAILPAEADQADVDRLTRKGMVVDNAAAAAVEAEPAAEPESVKPAKATKAAG